MAASAPLSTHAVTVSTTGVDNCSTDGGVAVTTEAQTATVTEHEKNLSMDKDKVSMQEDKAELEENSTEDGDGSQNGTVEISKEGAEVTEGATSDFTEVQHNHQVVCPN